MVRLGPALFERESPRCGRLPWTPLAWSPLCLFATPHARFLYQHLGLSLFHLVSYSTTSCQSPAIDNQLIALYQQFIYDIITRRPSISTLLQVNINYLSTSCSIALLENIAICPLLLFSITNSHLLSQIIGIFTSIVPSLARLHYPPLIIYSRLTIVTLKDTMLVIYPLTYISASSFSLLYLLSDLTSFMLSLLSFVFLPSLYIRCTFFVFCSLLSHYNLRHGPLFFRQGCPS